jgi:ATP-dependent protease HslVU (ClpYQ) peptidase subunit
LTVIVGIAQDGHVCIGGDSAGIAGLDLTVRTDQKVFRNGDFIFGFTSSFRMGQLLRYAFRPPDHDPRVPTEKYMVTTFIDAVRTCLKQGGYATTRDGGEAGGTFVVGYVGALYVVESDYQVGIPAAGYAAVGCGDSVALGALYATNDKPVRERVEIALAAAERFSAGVCGPFTILEASTLDIKPQ